MSAEQTWQGASAAESRDSGQLRRELRFWEAVALSIGIMAPTAAMALNGVAPAGLVGRVVPLAFLIAAIAIALIAYAFIQLTRHFSHAGSAYALAGATLGPRAGFFAGWALLGTYVAFTIASTAEVGLFAEDFLTSTGWWANADWLIIALVAAGLIWLLASRDIRLATRVLLSAEGISVLLIVVLVVVIFVKIGGGTAPNHQRFSATAFVPAHGIGVGAIAFASVFGLLSYGGFEGAAALGEETANPRRNIPRAIAAAVAFAGVFYTIVMYAESIGFGLGSTGVKAFASSSAPLGDLAHSFMGKSMAYVIEAGAALSALASALGAATGASRMLFALGRDGFISTRLGRLSRRTGEPALALSVVMVVGVVGVIAFRIAGTSAANVFFYLGTIGVLSMLIAYLMVQVGAAKYLHLERREPRWRVVVIVLAVAAIGYTLYKQVSPRPAPPYDWFPFVVGGWAAVGIGVTLCFPALTRRIGSRLAENEATRGDDARAVAEPPGSLS